MLVPLSSIISDTVGSSFQVDVVHEIDVTDLEKGGDVDRKVVMSTAV